MSSNYWTAPILFCIITRISIDLLPKSTAILYRVVKYNFFVYLDLIEQRTQLPLSNSIMTFRRMKMMSCDLTL